MRRFRSAAVRLVALVIVGLFVGPALAECAGWAASTTGRHGCCANQGGMAPGTSLRDCCAMSQQSDAATPPEMQVARMPLKLLDLPLTQFADWFLQSPATLLGESITLRRAALVPIYLQQASLLI